jgi:negative regulator of flagellin synthesis FlgM
MNVSGNYRIQGPHALQGPHVTRPTAPAAEASATRGADQVEISAAAEQALATDRGQFRADLVARVQREIAEGTYETAAKLDAAVNRLLDEMG